MLLERLERFLGELEGGVEAVDHDEHVVEHVAQVFFERVDRLEEQLEPVERAEGESLVRLGMARWTPAGLAVRNDLTKLHYDTEYLAQAEERLRHREEVPCG